ncbi:MAG: OmpA family protein [Granulicella sp.]
MQHKILVALVLVTAGVSAATAQRRPAAAATAPRADLSLGYNYIGANAPPGGKDYFGLQGGYVSGSFGLKDWLSVAGKFTGGHASKISTLGQDLTLMTFMGGPRISRPGHRLVPFAQALFGGAHASDSFFPTGTTSTTSATSFAFTAGGGLDIGLNDRFSVRALDVEYLRTKFPNGSSNEQNQIMVGAGIVMHFGGGNRGQSYTPPPQPGQVSFACTSNMATIEQGKVLEISGTAVTLPGKLQVNYDWSSSGGLIEGMGRRVTLNTTGLLPGDYRVTGHASLSSDPSTTAGCEVAFRVIAAPATAAVVTGDDAAKNDKVFHDNVPDALFDYDSYEIRPDAQVAVLHAAQYLKDNPTIGVLIGGYADERGSAEYNLALAEKRANAARNALIAAGVASDRLQIISYGKEAQVCTTQTESCFQQNRRAAFGMRH